MPNLVEPSLDKIDLEHLLKDCPDAIDVPNLVEPSLDKIDLEHLLRDQPKYKPWLSATAWEHWEEFMWHTEDLGKVQHCDSIWEIPKLTSAAITRPTHSESVSISSDTLALLAKETNAPPMVWIQPKDVIMEFIDLCMYCTYFV